MADTDNTPGTPGGSDKDKPAPVTLEQLKEQLTKVGGVIEEFGKSQKGMRSLLDRRTTEWRQGLEKITAPRGGRNRPGSGWDDDPNPDPYADPGQNRPVVDEENRSATKELREENEILSERLAIMEFKGSSPKATEYWPRILTILKDEDARRDHIVRDSRGKLDYGRSIRTVHLYLREQDLQKLEGEAETKKKEQENTRITDVNRAFISGDNVTGETPTKDVAAMSADEMQKEFPEIFSKDNPPEPVQKKIEGK